MNTDVLVLDEKFNLEDYHSKRKNFNNIQAEIERLVIEKNITRVIILDEVNFLSSAILNDLKMLINFNNVLMNFVYCFSNRFFKSNLLGVELWRKMNKV